MTLCSVVMLLGNHTLVHIQGHLLALIKIVVCCASMACVAMAEVG
jgi:hypothetical protein